MKHLFTLLTLACFLVLAIPTHSYSQTDSVTIKREIDMKEEFKRRLDSVQRQIAKQNVGILSLRKTTIYKYNDDDHTAKKVDIKKVDINIQDGVIFSIQVNTNDTNVFSNEFAPISLSSFSKRTKDRLNQQTAGKKHYIYLGEVLWYESKYGKLALPDDTTITLSPNIKEQADLTLDPSLASVIEGRIYSDVLALSGKSNGVLQTEFYSKFRGNTRNIPNSRFVFFNYVSPYFSFAKFDSKFDSLTLKPDTSTSRMSILQLSSVQYGIKLNVLSYYRMYRFEISTGLQGNITRNAVFPNSTVSDINQYSIYGQIGGVFTRGDNFGCELSAKLTYSWLADVPELNPTLNPKSIWIFNPEANLFWYAGNEKNNKVFFRYRGFYNMSDADTNFIQLQLGYSFNINALFN